MYLANKKYNNDLKYNQGMSFKTRLSRLDSVIENSFPEEVKKIRRFYFIKEEGANERNTEKGNAEK